MGYDFKEANNIVDWPSVTPGELSFDDVPADKIGYDATGNGQANFVEGWQYKNENLIFAFDRSRPTVILNLDPSIATAVRMLLGKDLASPVTVEDVAGLATLTAHGVTTLAGLEHFSNLRELDLGASTFSDISPLASLTKLVRLNLRDNPNLTDITSLARIDTLKIVNVMQISPTRLTALVADELRGAGVLVLEDQGLFGTFVQHFTLHVEALPYYINADAYLLFNSFTNAYSIFINTPSDMNLGPETITDVTFKLGAIGVGEAVSIQQAPVIFGHSIAYLGLNNNLTIELDSTESSPYMTGESAYWEPSDSDQSGLVLSDIDADLLAALQGQFFLEENEPVQLIQLMQVRTLDLSRSGLVDITALQLAANLNSLDLSFNQVVDVSPLEHLPLTNLDLMRNETLYDLSDLDIGSFDHLNLVGIQAVEPAASNLANAYASNPDAVLVDVDKAMSIEAALDKVSGESSEVVVARITAAYSRRARTFSGLIELTAGISITSAVIYDGETPFFTFTDPEVSSLAVEEIYLSTPLQIKVTDHGLVDGQSVRISGSVGIAELTNDVTFIIRKDDDNLFSLLGTMTRTGDVVASKGNLITSACEINSDFLVGLPQEWYLVVTLSDESVHHLSSVDVYTYAELPSMVFGLPHGAALNDDSITLHSRNITGATNDTPPIVITIDDPAVFDDGAVVLIEDVNGNLAANGEYTIHVLDPATTFELLGSAGSAAYTDGGKATPVPYGGASEVDASLIYNPFLGMYLYELAFSNPVPNTTQISIEDQTGYVLFTLTNADPVEFTLHQAEIDRLTLRVGVDQVPLMPVLKVYNLSYNTGAIATTNSNRFYGKAEMGDVWVKLCTALTVEGFAVDDLIITLPAVMVQPILVGPIQTIFNTAAVVDGTAYYDLVQLQFASAIEGAAPSTGDIKVAAIKIGVNR